MPAELQRRVVAEVEQTRRRSGFGIEETLKHLGVSRSSYYRWRQQESWQQEPGEPVRPVQVFEALPEEKRAVKEYALAHPEIRHRELAWKMIDEDVAFLSSSTVYRILREANLMFRRPGRTKRYRTQHEKAGRADEIWGTDLMYLTIGGIEYYLTMFIDEYSRYLVHWELMSSMDGHSIKRAAEQALADLPRDECGQLLVKPIIRSDNGSGYISREFGGLLAFHGLTHHRIKPYCPEENGVMERCNRTLREAIEVHSLDDRYQAETVIGRIVDHYNQQRLHSALGFQTPATWYRGDPHQVRRQRKKKLWQARHRRKQINLGIRQRTLPISETENAN